MRVMEEVALLVLLVSGELEYNLIYPGLESDFQRPSSRRKPAGAFYGSIGPKGAERRQLALDTYARLLGTAAQLGSRIIGGFTCAKNSQPWHAGIYDSNRFYCSGALLSRNWVVTAAHCKTPGNTFVRLGKHNMARNEGTEQQRNVAKQIVHPNYDPVSKDNDIMLMKLSSSVDINDSAQPISLATQCAPPGTQCLVTGWGTITSPKPKIPTELQCAFLIIIPQKECEEVYPDAITPNMICAGWREGGADSCQGDSGGPLICNEALQGIVSWGPEVCGQPRKPGMYTKVCNYVGWIQWIIRSM